ncbi:EscD/YscD/HrpQ family type III secretion system inner membrane ring protein [Burkholderia sp. Bp9126]|nr:EscD/YscD/HrpQ family type III secretion system inner membrane ring protein [Burkholderia sp. Bp9126]
MHKLKWLNGPLAGLEFDLPIGETRIGGDEADVVLPLEENAQAVLTSTDDGVHVTLDATVWVDGRPWDGKGVLPFDRAIDVGGVAFVLGNCNDILSMPSVPQRKRILIRSSQTWLRMCAVTLSTSVLAAGVMLVLWRPADLERFDVDAWLKQQLKAPALQGLRAQRAADGVVVVSGRCLSSKDVERLRAKLRDKGFVTRDESLCADKLRNAVRNVLALNGYLDVDVRSAAAPDSVEIRGAIAADAAWQHVVSQLQDVRGLRAWRIVNDRAQWFDRLYETLLRHRSIDNVNIVMSGKTLIVSGAVSSTRAITEAIAEFNRYSTDGFVATWQDVPSLQAVSAWLPYPVVTVGGNAGAVYVVLANGMRLQLGGRLPNGYAIVHLTRHSMGLRKDQHLVSVPLDV